jgi:hypothetical protein
MCTIPVVTRCVRPRAAHAVSRARCAAWVGGGGWVQHGTTVRYSELADPHCLHVSFTPDISLSTWHLDAVVLPLPVKELHVVKICCMLYSFRCDAPASLGGD